MHRIRIKHHRARRRRAFAAAATAVLLAVVPVAQAWARPRLLLPPRGHDYFGVTDTGVESDFKSFAEAVGRHPAVIETFQRWHGPLRGSLARWQHAHARPMLHVTTAASDGVTETITPRAIALGRGDNYLYRLNGLFWSHHLRGYLRPLGEPNRCLNVYAAYDCGGGLRAGHSPYWYRQAFRRIYIVVHGGGKRAKINRRLARVGLPGLAARHRKPPVGLPAAPVAVVWSPLTNGSPGIRGNAPSNYYPGSRYVDWVGTDFYSDYPGWKSLTRFYRRYRGTPFVLSEWGLVGSDDSRYVRRLFSWARHHRRCRTLVYYQDFGESNPYRIQRYPASLRVVRHHLNSRRFVALAAHAPHPKLPPPHKGGVSP